MIIHPICGLCNYLRVVFSYYQKALKDNEELVVIWRKTAECPGYFLDYFEKIDKIKFVSDNKNFKNIYYKGFSICPEFLPNYKYLKPCKKISKKIIKNIKLLENNYDAIHIRRTDHIAIAKSFNKFTSDEEFIDFVDKSKSKYLYIATDNRETQNKFFDKYSKKLKVIKFIDSSKIKNLRKTSLEDAIIDLFMCVYSKNFKGSSFSSFSDTIRDIRKQVPPILDI